MDKTYRAWMLKKKGGPEALVLLELPLADPGTGQIRVRVEAAGVGATDLTVLQGRYLFAPKIPFVPGYELAGIVDAIGPGVTGFELGQRVAALTVWGAFAEMAVREATEFVRVPEGVSSRDAAAVVLNSVTAWQMIHRVAKVNPGQTALVTAAAGGVGSAALQLLQLAGVKTYGSCSAKKLALVQRLGATALNREAGEIDEQLLRLEPRGVDVAFDAIGGTNTARCIRAVRRGGMVVGYGFVGAPGTGQVLGTFANLFVGARLKGRRGTAYGITALYRRDPKPFHEDLPKIFELLKEKKIDPAISHTFDLLEAPKALELLATGSVEGKTVLARGAS